MGRVPSGSGDHTSTSLLPVNFLSDSQAGLAGEIPTKLFKWMSKVFLSLIWAGGGLKEGVNGKGGRKFRRGWSRSRAEKDGEAHLHRPAFDRTRRMLAVAASMASSTINGLTPGQQQQKRCLAKLPLPPSVTDLVSRHVTCLGLFNFVLSNSSSRSG
jgi:hypothetical protein